jgi:hypothetical protein
MGIIKGIKSQNLPFFLIIIGRTDSVSSSSINSLLLSVSIGIMTPFPVENLKKKLVEIYHLLF